LLFKAVNVINKTVCIANEKTLKILKAENLLSENRKQNILIKEFCPNEINMQEYKNLKSLDFTVSICSSAKLLKQQSI